MYLYFPIEMMASFSLSLSHYESEIANYDLSLSLCLKNAIPANCKLLQTKVLWIEMKFY